MQATFNAENVAMNRFKTTIINMLARSLSLRIKNSLLHASFHLAPQEFEQYSYDYAFAPNMALGLAAVARRGFAPKTIVDVGAFVGDWSRVAREIWPATRLIMVEPNVAKRPQLETVAKDLNAELHVELLGAEDNRPIDFYIMESGSSVMSEHSLVPRTTETRHLRRLDSILGSIEPPGLLKIDAQGYELEILKGARKLLPAFEAILLEVAIIEINHGAPLVHEVLPFMKSLGFVTYDIMQFHRRPLDGALNQVDVIFVREQSGLIADKRHYA
jgi:FkbM family methyltransferase